jgi:hypothetical protein
VSSNRRLVGLAIAAVVIALPAATLRVLCVGRSCGAVAPAAARVPFCSLPSEVRDLLAAGFYDGRGPHVMAVTGKTSVRGDAPRGALPAPWPSVEPGDQGVVPLVFAGTGLRPGATIPQGTTLDAVAPTVADAIGLRRPHPGVRSGRAIPGVADPTTRPPLVVLVVWKGVGTTDLRDDPVAWPTLRGLVEDHPATLRAEVGSLPLDPAAVLTTIGSGALPQDHGITGRLVRSERGAPVRAWGPRSPFSVVATLGDDLDELLGQRPRIGAVVDDQTDRGVIGGNWYVESDPDDLAFERSPSGRAAAELLSNGYGADEVPDLLAVTMEGGIRDMDRALARVVTASERVSDGRVLMVVTATGSTRGPAVPAPDIEADLQRLVGVDVVEDVSTAGLFLDQDALSQADVTDDQVIEALRRLRAPDGGRLLADAFPQVAVTFAGYC